MVILPQNSGYFSILRFAQFVHLAFMTVFNIVSDGILHTFPVHCSAECLSETGRSRVLEVVVVPTDCSMLKGNQKDHGSSFAHYLCIFHQLSGVLRIRSQFENIGACCLIFRPQFP